MPDKYSSDADWEEEEFAELKRTHDEILKLRDQRAAEEASLKRTMAELEAAKAAASQTVEDLYKEMQAREFERDLEEIADLKHRMTHDDLTGVWNRGVILEVLREQLALAKREGKTIAVALADLDHFKGVNDTYGHLAGDAVLREAAQRISAAVRSYDSVGRYGDNYFLIVLASCDDETDMVKQAERIRAMVCAEPVHAKEGSIAITVSIGAASSANCREEEALIGAADKALYRAKRAGGNRVELA